MKKILFFIYALLIVAATMAQTPVAYYPFNGNANDASGNGLHGVINGSVVPTADRFGNANSAMAFPGNTNSFIQIADNPLLRPANITISCWINLAGVGSLNTFVHKGLSPCVNDSWYVGTESGNFRSYVSNSFTCGDQVSLSIAQVNNVWKYVAFTVDVTTDTRKLYIDGVEVASGTFTSSLQYDNGPVTLGAGFENGIMSFPLTGALDEVKVYSTVLNPAQILNEYIAAAPTTATLIAHYPLNGNANDISGNNLNGTIIGSPVFVTDRSGITNSALEFNGNIANRIEVNDNALLHPASVTIAAWVQLNNLSGLKSFVDKPMGTSFMDSWHFGTEGSNYSSWHFNSPTNQNPFSQVTAPATTGQWHYMVNTFDNVTKEHKLYIDGVLKTSILFNSTIGYDNSKMYIGAGIENGNLDFSMNGILDEIKIYNGVLSQGQVLTEYYSYVLQQKPGSGNAINFDGVDDVVVNPGSSAVNFGPNNNFAIDFWIKLPVNQTNLAFVDNMIMDKWVQSASEPYPFSIRCGNATSIVNGQIQLNRYDGTNVTSVVSNVPFNDDKWHHVACVKNGNTILIYKDGVLTNTGADVVTSSTSNNYNLHFGARGTTANFFTGGLDEVRIWNTALTQTQIRDRMCRKITSTDALYSNLVAYYNFDEAAGVTTIDGTGNANNGALTNGTARVISGAPIGNAAAHDYVNSTKTVSLTYPTGESFTATSTSGNPDAIHVYRVDEVPNTLSGTNGVGGNNKYFGVFQVGGTTPQYTAVYNYNGNPLVNAANESTLALFKRTDNAATAWSNGSAALNTTAKTLTLTGQSTEYILGSTGAALPLNLISFTGTKQNNNALLQWQTANEINVARYEIQRSINGQLFTTAGTKNAGAVNYLFEDVNAFATQQKLFYRLKSIDKDGRFSYSGTVLLQAYDAGTVTVFPNPVTTTVTISNLKQNSIVKLVNTTGSVVHRQTVTAQSITINMQSLAAGLYVLQYQNKQTGVTETITIIKQ